MGGVGSGGRGRLSDEERKRRGTFRADESNEVRDRAAAARVLVGPWLDTIPEPTIPLGEVGRKKYDDLTRLLHGQHKLTLVTQMHAEMAARQFEKIYKLTVAGQDPTASDMTQLNRSLDALKVAENAPTISDPGGKPNEFAQCGWSNRRNAAVRLRLASSSGS
jgi:hypothetical protein